MKLSVALSTGMRVSGGIFGRNDSVRCWRHGPWYFASANQFEDEFEGAVTVQLNEGPEDPRYVGMEGAEGAFFELKRLTKISCWHFAEYESDAMWKLYGAQKKGVAICTTPERMRHAFKPFRLRPDYGLEEMWAGPVTYVDLTQVRMRNVGMLGRFFHKHRAFESEREFRLAISLRMAEEFAVRVPEDGISVKVDLDCLVDRIVLGSTTSPEEREQIVRGRGTCRAQGSIGTINAPWTSPLHLSKENRVGRPVSAPSRNRVRIGPNGVTLPEFS